jgi:uncharacterized RDD family membrane protein YckC
MFSIILAPGESQPKIKNSLQMETTEQHLFADPEYQIVQASGGKRFANYLIDVIVFYILMFGVGFLIAIINPATIDSLNSDEVGTDLLDRLLSLVLYGLYMFVIEALFKGKSLGKLITGTRAVNADGSNISGVTALLRGLSRAVPFNALSALGTPSYPWHDKWTKTYVIDERLSNRPADE